MSQHSLPAIGCAAEKGTQAWLLPRDAGSPRVVGLRLISSFSFKSFWVTYNLGALQFGALFIA